MRAISIIITIGLLASSGCTFVERNTIGLFRGGEGTEAALGGEEGTTGTSPDPTSSTRAARGEPSPPVPAPSDIEIVWEMPKAAVDGYLIRYGASRERLTTEVRVNASDLMREEDTDHGFVYRYLLKGVPADKVVFVSIAAITGDQVSAPSEVLEVGAS